MQIAYPAVLLFVSNNLPLPCPGYVQLMIEKSGAYKPGLAVSIFAKPVLL